MQARLHYSSLATDTRLENTSPSTGGSEVPAYSNNYSCAAIFMLVNKYKNGSPYQPFIFLNTIKWDKW